MKTCTREGIALDVMYALREIVKMLNAGYLSLS